MQTNLTVKGQVTIPKAMRDHLGLAAGAPVRFAYTEGGGVAILPAIARRAQAKAVTSRFDKLKGSNRNGWAAAGVKSTDEIMGWLRGYGEDARDPGFTATARVHQEKEAGAKQLASRRAARAAKPPAKRAAKAIGAGKR
jgi:antitoxin PrlF